MQFAIFILPLIQQNGKDMTNTIEQLKTNKDILLKQANALSVEFKKLYANVDIESPMSKEEKEMKHQISELFSQVNTIVKEINALRKSK